MVSARTEIYDASGAVIVNMNSRLVKFVAIVTTGITNGSYTNSRLTGKNVVVHVLPKTTTDKGYTPKITGSGPGSSGTIAWSFDGGVTRDKYSCDLAIGYI